ncbi:MAG: hypothetical protein AB7F86_15900 [Bdellovibrionales bacterium]
MNRKFLTALIATASLGGWATALETTTKDLTLEPIALSSFFEPRTEADLQAMLAKSQDLENALKADESGS